MAGQRVGKPAHFAPAHGVGLAGDGKRAHAGLADAARGKVAVDDRVDLVRAGRRLVHPLRKDGDDLFRAGPQVAKGGDLRGCQASDVAILRLRGAQGFVKTINVAQVGGINGAALVDRGKQAVEQGDIAARFQRQMHICQIAGCGAARVDDDHAHRGVCGLGGGKALINNRMTPRQIAADQHDKVGKLKVLVGARDGVGAKGAFLPRHGRGHAEARVCVDIGRADETFHQLVGDIVILGQQLARDIEGNRIRAVVGDGLAETVRDKAKRRVPIRVHIQHAGRQQTVVQRECFAQRKAFGTQPPKVCRMCGIAAHRDSARPVRLRQHAAANAAIGAGGADFAGLLRAGVHHATCARRSLAVSSRMRPPSTRMG